MAKYVWKFGYPESLDYLPYLIGSCQTQIPNEIYTILLGQLQKLKWTNYKRNTARHYQRGNIRLTVDIDQSERQVSELNYCDLQFQKSELLTGMVYCLREEKLPLHCFSTVLDSIGSEKVLSYLFSNAEFRMTLRETVEEPKEGEEIFGTIAELEIDADDSEQLQSGILFLEEKIRLHPVLESFFQSSRTKGTSD